MSYIIPIVSLLACMVFFSFPLANSSVKVSLLAVGTKMESRSNGKFINMSCSFRPNLSPANQTIDCDIEVFREGMEIKLVVAYYIVTMNKLVQTALFKRSIDVCFFVRNPRSDRLVNTVYNYIRQHSNLPIRCPVTAGKYYIRNARPSDVSIPAFLPEGEFILEEIYRSEGKHEPLLEFRFYGKLVRFIETSKTV